MNDRWLDGGLVVLFGFLYFSLCYMAMPPGPMPGDGAELTYGMIHFQEVHAPGYPLYVSLGFLAIQVLTIPASTVAHSISAVFMTLALVGFYGFLREQSLGYTVSWLTTLFLAFSYPVWRLAVQAEVYSMALFFFVATLLLTESVLKRDQGRRLLWFCVGLSFAHHPLAIFNLLLAVYATVRSARRIERTELVLFGVPVTIYFLLFLSGTGFPFNWTQVGNLEAFLSHILGGNLTRYVLRDGLITPLLKSVEIVGLHLMAFPIVIFALALMGYGSAPNRLNYLIVFQVILLGVLSLYGIPDLADYLLLSYVLFAIFFAYGLERVFHMNWIFAGSLVLACVLSLVVTAFAFDQQYDYSKFTFSRSYASRVNETVSQGIILSDWSRYTVLRYYQLRRGYLDDVRLFPLAMTSDTWKYMVEDHYRRDINVYATVDNWEVPDRYHLVDLESVFRVRRQ